MANIAKIRTNAGDCDWKAASNQLAWAAYHARQMGFMVPTEVEAALLILEGQACITYFSNATISPTIICVGKPETDEDFEDHMDMVEFVCARLKARRLRALAKKAEATVIGYEWPSP